MPWDLKKTFISALQHGVEETLRNSFLFFPANITDYLSIACGLYFCQERIRSDFHRLLLSSYLKENWSLACQEEKMGRWAISSMLSFNPKNIVTQHTSITTTKKKKHNRVGKAGMPPCLAKVLLWTPYLNFPNTTDLWEVLCKMLLVLCPEELLEVSILNMEWISSEIPGLELCVW